MYPSQFAPEVIVQLWRARQLELDRALELHRQLALSPATSENHAVLLSRAGDLFISVGFWLKERSEPAPQPVLSAGR
jgi:lipopolysaccharide biosynthesis regulator YciM